MLRIFNRLCLLPSHRYLCRGYYNNYKSYSIIYQLRTVIFPFFSLFSVLFSSPKFNLLGDSLSIKKNATLSLSRCLHSYLPFMKEEFLGLYSQGRARLCTYSVAQQHEGKAQPSAGTGALSKPCPSDCAAETLELCVPLSKSCHIWGCSQSLPGLTKSCHEGEVLQILSSKVGTHLRLQF